MSSRLAGISFVAAALVVAAVVSTRSAGSQSSGSAQGEAAANPLFTASALPFQAPPFDKIKDRDFAPAFEEGMKRQLSEIAQIADNPAPPAFDNTLIALEKSGDMLTRVNLAFNTLAGAN